MGRYFGYRIGKILEGHAKDLLLLRNCANLADGRKVQPGKKKGVSLWGLCKDLESWVPISPEKTGDWDRYIETSKTSLSPREKILHRNGSPRPAREISISVPI